MGFFDKIKNAIQAARLSKEDPIYIDSILSINEEHIGKYVQLTARFYGDLREKKGELYQHAPRNSVTVHMELTRPFLKCPFHTTPSSFRGILKKSDYNFTYILSNAEPQDYFRNARGDVQCRKQSCDHPCGKDCPIYLNNLGEEKIKEHKQEEAIELFERAVFLAADYMEARCNLGYAYLDAQRNAEAYDIFSGSSDYCVDGERIRYGRIVSCIKVGRYAEAKLYLERYKTMFPSHDVETLSKLVRDSIPDVQEKPRMTDEEYRVLFVQKGFDAFWDAVIEEKERTFATEVCGYNGVEYRKRCEKLKSWARFDITIPKKGKEILFYRTALLKDKVRGADSMLLFDVIDYYEDRYIIY